MSSRIKLLSVAGAALILGSCHGALASSDDDKVFGERVRAYLMAHPEVLEQAGEKLQADTQARVEAAQRKAEASLPMLRTAIERDPRDFVANPDGAITVTEFYDYRCPHCEAMAPEILTLIRTRPDIRFVFKEMPIFGATSEHAAYAALAVKRDKGDYLGLYRALMAARPLDDAAIDKIAEENGARPSDIAPSASSTAQLASTSALFDRLALDGTPGFVVGGQIFAGDDMQALKSAIEKAGPPPDKTATTPIKSPS